LSKFYWLSSSTCTTGIF